MDQAPFASLDFDSKVLPVGRQFATFASAMVNFAVSRDAEGPFAATAKVWRVGALMLTEAMVDPVLYDRDMVRIAADQVDHLYVNYHLSGGADFDDGEQVRRVDEGGLLVIDMRQPSRMAAHDRHIISVAIPRHLLLPRLEPFDPHGLIAHGGLVPLLGSTLRAICAALPETPATQAALVERLIVDLTAEALGDALRAAETVSRREESLRMRVRAYLDANLGEALDVAAICRELGVSRSRLYRVCNGGGGVVRLLQQRRLRRMRALLEDRGETRPIGELAEAMGFRDKSHFSRAFKQAYGIAPSVFRAGWQQNEQRSVVPGHDAARLFGRWVGEVD
jgi:AraC-like DNA-binding protein